MLDDRWPELYASQSALSGNVAKVKVMHELRHLATKGTKISVLDIGCIGPRPLEFWEPLLADKDSHFQLTGVDKDVENAREIVAQRGWNDQVILLRGSGYDLKDMFACQSFNVVVATQVLEHIARLRFFMQQVAATLCPGGEGFFTVDSAHWRSRFDSRNPVRLAKNILKKGLSRFRYEHHYDLPWLDHEVAESCREAGLEIIECRYYNLAPLKFIHNHLVPVHRKNAFMQLWMDLEEFLNEDELVREKAKHFFLDFYVHFRKP